jgi:uncharacterized protein YjiS (DUF1127 family)
MSFKEEMELLRLERLINITKSRDMRIYLHTRKLADLDTAEANGVIPSEDIEYSRDRENRQYEYDMESFQSALDDLNEPDLPRITPEMLELWRTYDAQVQMREQLTVTDFMKEQSNREMKLWRMFCKLMRSEE